MPETAWTDGETIRTRERFRLFSGQNDNVSHRHGELAEIHSGPIEYTEYVAVILGPGTAPGPGDDWPGVWWTAMTSDPLADDAEQRASFIRNQRWLTTPIERFPDPEEYDALLHVTGSVAHVHDFDPLVSKEAELRAEHLAAFDADPPVGGITFRYHEWEVNPSAWPLVPWGTHTNRRIEYTLANLGAHHYDRAGDFIDTYDGPDVRPHSLLYGRKEVLYDPEASVPTYSMDPDLGMWRSNLGVHLYGIPWARFHVGAPPEVVGVIDPGFEDGTWSTDIDDAEWNAEAWPVQRGGIYRNLGLPILIAPEAAWNLEDPVTDEGEEDTLYTATLALWFESDWTPPRYRIVYTTEEQPEPKVLRQMQRKDGLGEHSAVRSYQSPQAERGLGPP
jgi:hypothetical protein